MLRRKSAIHGWKAGKSTKTHTPGTDKDCFHRSGTVDVDIPLGIEITNCRGEVVHLGDGDARKSSKQALTVLTPGDLLRNRVLRVIIISIELLAGLQQDGQAILCHAAAMSMEGLDAPVNHRLRGVGQNLGDDLQDVLHSKADTRTPEAPILELGELT